MWCCDPMMSTRRVQASRALWEDEGEHRHFCDSTGSLDAPLTRGVHDDEALLNWSLREQLAWGSAETHHFMFAHATGRLCTPPSNRLAAVLTTICTHTTGLADVVYRPAALYLAHHRALPRSLLSQTSVDLRHASL